MADKLLVRMYNVGLGDCIYVQVPDENGIDGKVHILIDCGNKFGEMNVLKEAIDHIVQNLPTDPQSNKKHLDLLVVTHPHEDHHKGFEPDSFENIRIKNLWLSPAFCELDDDIPEKEPNQAAPKSRFNSLRALQTVAQSGLNRLLNASPAEETKGFLEDLLLSLSKADALSVLNGKAKKGKKLDVENRRYVSWDFSYEANTQKDLSTIDQWGPFTEDDLKSLFRDQKTKIKILAPRGNLDTYLSAPKPSPTANTNSPQTNRLSDEIDDPAKLDEKAKLVKELEKQVLAPKNISIQDFELLRAGIQSNVLAAAAELGHAINNLSIVLLLEWNGYRLLFPGDAEWDGSKIELKDSNNGSWNVMWHDDKAGELKKQIDFLKVGHHGSENATPWARTEKGEDHPINVILNALLPEPEGNNKPTAWAVVSTQETSRWVSIPDPALLRAIGKRVFNVKTFGKDLRFKNDDRTKYKIYTELSFLPARTDQFDLDHGEEDKKPQPSAWIDVSFPP